MGAADPVEMLDELLRCMEAGTVPRPETRQWFAQGIRGVVHGMSFETALSLVCHGQRSLIDRFRRYRRDQYLSLAMRAVALDPGLTSWQRCTRLAPLLSRYVAGAWRVDRLRTDPPPGVELWRLYAWYALEVGGDAPTTPRGLYDAVKRVRDPSFHPAAPTLRAHFMSLSCQQQQPKPSPSSAPSAPP